MKSVLALIIGSLSVVLSASAQITLNPTPTRVIGQKSLTITNLNPNLVEGREFFSPLGIALDLSTNPPGLYVADTNNNRVLGYRSAVGFANGQKADIVLGQADFVTTIAQGPGSSRGGRSTGFTAPTGLTVDAAGNLYVVDSGNNRVLRFPKPFSQTTDQLPDLVIGQPNFSTNGPNQGGISASTLLLANSSTFQAYATLDAVGNLWVADAGNNRILRFNAAVLGNQPSPGPAADIVLGQSDFATGTYAPPANRATSTSTINTPTGIVFDSGGRLFVSESTGTSNGRILVWNPPFTSGQVAARILGVDTDTPAPPVISQFQIGPGSGGLFTINNGSQVGIADTINNRILVFPPASQWTPNNLYQAAVLEAGQPDFNSGKANQGQPTASASTLSHPAAAAWSGSELFVADTLNHRVVPLPLGSSFGPATRVLGQDGLNLNTANLLEGREFDFSAFSSTGGDAGLAVDLNANPPHLYVADTYNNRILGYNDLRNIQPGAKADIVIGQPDFQQSLVNYPSNNANTPNASGLFHPTGILVDQNGDLFVADSGNGRVLRFASPFNNYKAGVPEPANLVLGQSNFFSTITDATDRTMSSPYGLAMTLFPGLLVSDVVHSRVLFFPGSSSTFTNGESATVVFGQPDFTSFGAGSGLAQMNSPRHISTDSDDRLYVADSGNGRVLIFDHAPNSINGRPAAVTLTAGLSSPHGVYVSPVNGDIWVTDARTNAGIRYPAFNNLQITGNKPNATLSEFAPLAVVEDAWGNVFFADDANRVVIHYPGLSSLNAANFLSNNVLAPGEIAALYSTGNQHQFGGADTSAPAGILPLPRTLNGIQVLFNGSPVPLFFAGRDQVNFQVPMAAPQSGTADLQVLEVATGRLLGDATVNMVPVAPGLFSAAGNGSGAAAATNEDGSINSQSNPAVAGHIITLYGTGQGFIAGGPPDGNVSGTALQTSRAPTVYIGADVLTGSDVPYAGLAPTLVGVWQINVRIPTHTITLPNNPTTVLVQQASVFSGDATRVIQIYVKQP